MPDQLEARGIDGLVLLGSSSVAYAGGTAVPGQDGDRAALFCPVTVVGRGDPASVGECLERVTVRIDSAGSSALTRHGRP